MLYFYKEENPQAQLLLKKALTRCWNLIFAFSQCFLENSSSSCKHRPFSFFKKFHFWIPLGLYHQWGGEQYLAGQCNARCPTQSLQEARCSYRSFSAHPIAFLENEFLPLTFCVFWRISLHLSGGSVPLDLTNPLKFQIIWTMSVCFIIQINLRFSAEVKLKFSSQLLFFASFLLLFFSHIWLEFETFQYPLEVTRRVEWMVSV